MGTHAEPDISFAQLFDRLASPAAYFSCTACPQKRAYDKLLMFHNYLNMRYFITPNVTGMLQKQYDLLIRAVFPAFILNWLNLKDSKSHKDRDSGNILQVQASTELFVLFILNEMCTKSVNSRISVLQYIS